METVWVFQLVRLTGEGYSVPVGTIGFVRENCVHIPDAFVVTWLTEAPGSSSVPVYERDLAEAGTFSVPNR